MIEAMNHSRVHDYLTDTDEFIASVPFGGQLRCKFILLTDMGIAACVLGSLRHFPYHANLAEQFCAINSISGAWSHKPDRFEIYQKDVSITGGGWLQFDFQDKTLTIFGYSTSYGRFDEEATLSILKRYQPFEGYSLIID